MQPLVSVVIPTYQHGHLVQQAIDSVLAQTYENCEVVVVDDGSTDGTAQVLAAQGARVRAVYQENRGLSAARNTGIRDSAGEYVAFLDADDVWLPRKLELQVPVLQRDSKVGLVYGNVLTFDESGDRVGTAFCENPPRTGMVHTAMFVRTFIPMPTVIVRRACFEVVGFFDETLTSCEDHDMWLRISRLWAVEVVNHPLAKYRLSANQMHRDQTRMLRNMVRVQEKAFAASPELRALDLPTLDGCWYGLYLQLARLCLRHGASTEARAVLRKYAQLRVRSWGDLSWRYWETRLASRLPSGCLRVLFAARGGILNNSDA